MRLPLGLGVFNKSPQARPTGHPMLFNSYTYLLVFLPVALLGFNLIAGRNLRAAFAWAVLASLVFYGWWNPDPSQRWSPWYVFLILASCSGNYFFGRYLSLHKLSARGKRALACGVGANLALLGYYKYIGFFAAIAKAVTGAPAAFPHVILPLAISFFTFLQIAYLVDAWRGEAEEYHFTDYLLFVTFFPHLIAGPIVHHKEMMPQFMRPGRQRRAADIPVGLTILALGLFKKVVLADNLAPIANRLFHLAASGERDLTIAEAWLAALTYGLQLYFDFSGYSDMAIGSARLFGIRFPLNFHSPYKADSVIEFWRRWHMTLSRFLRDYLYIPLGGSRCPKWRRYTNLMATMLLGGLWHGAGWSFILWGGLHGLYLCANHLWLFFRERHRLPALPKPVAVLLTFVAVLVAWVPFRSGSFELGPSGSPAAALKASGSILSSMAGMHGLEAMPDKANRVIASGEPLKVLPVLLLCWLFPNTQQFLHRYRPALGMGVTRGSPRRRWWHWRPTVPFALATVILLIVTGLQFDKVSEFIYFQF